MGLERVRVLPCCLRGRWVVVVRIVLWFVLALGLVLPGLAWLPSSTTPASVGTPRQPLPESSEALALQSPWSRPASYPLSLRPRTDLYRPSADWIGRLILPTPAEITDAAAPREDWVWIELEQAPAEAQSSIGRRLRLLWAEDPALQRLVRAVTTDIRFGEQARLAAAQANVVPSRLNGRRQVGPLMSLAGARPADDLTVLLEGVRRHGDQLRIARPPVQISGRWQALVRFEGRANDGEADGAFDPGAASRASRASGPAPAGPVSGPVPVSLAHVNGLVRVPTDRPSGADDAPRFGSSAAASALASAPAWLPSSGAAAAPSSQPQDLWWVRHYNRTSRRFDGPHEIIRLPLLPPDRFGRRMFDPTGLERTPLNRQGWWIQGAPAADGLFTVQALEPRALLTPTPDRQISGTDASLATLLRGSWSSPQLIRGTLHSTALLPDGAQPLAWKPGERALLMHLFGGIGGKGGEPVSGWTATGHFAFGEARVVEDPFSGEPRLSLRYHQIYANNPNGIVAGSQDWSAYGGNLQRGWLGTRPFSDALIPLGPRALDAIALQAELLAARYRSGDGKGVALVTAATSCVQDSAQALWIALRQLQHQGPRPQASAEPPSPEQASRQQASRQQASGGQPLAPQPSPAEAERLRRLGLALDHLLTPFGRVRADWVHNSSLVLAGGRGTFQASQSPLDVLLSWRSLLPRGAHDSFAAEVLRSGLPLQLLRTNQIPGGDPRLEPMAPTILLGQLPVAGTLVARLGDALFPPPQAASPAWALLILAVYAPLALALGRRDGLLPRAWIWPPLPQLLRRGVASLLMPAFGEELLFRGLLLPHPLAGLTPLAMLPWIALSTGLFVLYHPLAGRLWYRQGRAVFDDPRFLLQCSLLGLACALAYGATGSLWWAVLIHWLAVVVWLEPLQGRWLLRGPGGARGTARPAPLT